MDEVWQEQQEQDNESGADLAEAWYYEQLQGGQDVGLQGNQ